VDAVRRYEVEWARKECFDARLLNEWLTKVIECIRNRIGVSLAQCILKAQEVTAKGMYRLTQAIYIVSAAGTPFISCYFFFRLFIHWMLSGADYS
jgi:hypothetical protein